MRPITYRPEPQDGFDSQAQEAYHAQNDVSLAIIVNGQIVASVDAPDLLDFDLGSSLATTSIMGDYVRPLIRKVAQGS